MNLNPEQAAEIAALADELDAAPGGTWSKSEADEGVVIEIPVIENAPAVRSFVWLAREFDLVVNFDWTSWQDETVQYIKGTQRLADADLDTLCELITTCVRKERFCEGTLAALHEQWVMAAICRRVGEVV